MLILIKISRMWRKRNKNIDLNNIYAAEAKFRTSEQMKGKFRLHEKYYFSMSAWSRIENLLTVGSLELRVCLSN